MIGLVYLSVVGFILGYALADIRYRVDKISSMLSYIIIILLISLLFAYIYYLNEVIWQI